MSGLVNWGTIKSLLIFFGPVLLPKAISYYRSLRSAPRQQGLYIQPLPPPLSRAVQLLVAVSIVYLVATLPPFAPENIFIRTQARLQFPLKSLFARLQELRPDHALTDADLILKEKFVNQESRYLYAKYGPDVLTNCVFCGADEISSYLFYALPDIIAPHLLNLVVLGVATSGSLLGKKSSFLGAPHQQGHDGVPVAGAADNTAVRIKKGATQWRQTFTLLSIAAVVIDCFVLKNWDHKENSSATRLDKVTWFYWNMRISRFLVLCIMDLSAAFLIWLSGTNRAFCVSGPSPAERIELLARALGAVKSRLSAAGIVKNTAIRDEELRSRQAAYWTHEVQLMSQVMEEREVIEGVNDALANRINVQSISRDAESYAQSVLQPMQMAQSMAQGNKKVD